MRESLNEYLGPIGFALNARTVTVGTADIEFEHGVTVVSLAPATGGQIDYVPLHGDDASPVSQGSMAAGDMVAHGNNVKIPVVVKTIKGTSTVTSVQVASY